MSNNLNKSRDEIDLLHIFQKIWDHRTFILKVTLVFFILGIFTAFLKQKEYTSTIEMAPQLGEDSKMGGLSNLASLAGINLSNLSNDQALSPTLYPQLIESITFRKELMQTKLKFKEINQPITLFDYYTKDEYKKIDVLGILYKYTVGIPGIILKKFKKDQPNIGNQYISLNENEFRLDNLLDDKIDIKLNVKEGSITLSASAPEALAATQLVIATQALLQQYITKIKIEKAKVHLEFIHERYMEVKYEYEECQRRLATFRDFNRNITSALTRTHEDKLVNDYNLSYTIYTEMAKQLEQAKIKVKDATPVFSIIRPAYVPFEKSSPKRVLIIFISILLGLTISVIYLFVYDFINNFKNK